MDAPLAAVTASLFLSVAATAVLADDAPSNHSPSRVCGLAWGELGYFDGAAGRAKQTHPYGSEAEAAQKCKAAGLRAPSFNAYAAQYGAGAYLRTQNAKRALGGGSSTRGDGASFPRRTSAYPDEALTAATSDPLRCRPSEVRRAGSVGAPPPIDCPTVATRPSTLRDLHKQGRRDRATADALRRIDADRQRLSRRLSLPSTSPAEQRFLQRDLRDAERQRRVLDIQRSVRPQLP